MPRLTLVAGVVAVSFAALFVRLAAPASGLAVAAGRLAIAAALLTAWSPRALARWWALPARERGLVALSGVCLGAHFGTWIESLYLTSTASSVTLVALQPVFAAALGHWLLRERVGAREAAGIAIAVAGTAIVAGGDWRADPRALAGDALALAGAALAAAYYIVGRRMRVAMDLVPYLAVVNLFGAGVLALAAAVAGVRITGFAWHVYAAIAGAAVVCSTFGHTLLNVSVRRAPAHLVSLAILGEPVGAALLTWIVVGETPPALAAAGGAVVLAGIAVGFSGRGAAPTA